MTSTVTRWSVNSVAPRPATCGRGLARLHGGREPARSRATPAFEDQDHVGLRPDWRAVDHGRGPQRGRPGAGNSPAGRIGCAMMAPSRPPSRSMPVSEAARGRRAIRS